MLSRLFLGVFLVFGPWLLEAQVVTPNQGEPGAPIRALLICGGCCHDYASQHKILFEGIQKRGNLQVDVWWTDDKSTNPPLPLFDSDDWAQGYDVIIHDECAAANRDVEVLKRILAVHETVPAVHLHCAMHSFRNGTDLWFEHLGLQSTGHGPHLPLQVTFVDREHPIVKGMSDWTIEKDELYNNAKMFGAHPLAMGTQVIKRDGKEKNAEAVVIWTNDIDGTRSFSMSIGHYSEGVADGRYLDLVTRGALWACRELKPENLVPFEGANQVTFVPGAKSPPKPKKPMAKKMPENPTLVHVRASSVESGRIAAKALDGNKKTRWCAKNGDYPQWLELDFQEPQKLDGIRIHWETKGPYQFRVLAEDVEGNSKVVVDHANATEQLKGFQPLENMKLPIKKIRIEGLGSANPNWCSIREVNLRQPAGKNQSSQPSRVLKTLWPADKNYKPLFQPTPAAGK